MSNTTEPYDVILALRRLRFSGPDECAAWLNAPNPDLGGISISLAVQRGQYDAAIRAIVMEIGRRGIAKHHPSLVEEGG